MATLKEIQTALHDYLQKKPSAIENLVVGKNAAETKRRLGIYREAYALRLRDNLLKQYPVLATFLGTGFQALADRYIAEFPPDDVVIRHYGAHLPGYLKSEQDPFLAELAAFEWAMNTALDDSANAELLTLEALQKLTPEVLFERRFLFNPSLTLLTFHYDIPHYWMNARKKKFTPKPALLKEPLYVGVWRKELIPYHGIFQPLEFQLLQEARAGTSFVGLCEVAAKSLSEEEAANRIAQAVFRWVKDGLISR